VAEHFPPGVAVEVDTWRPVEVADVGGWRVGFSGGFTSRANSVVPLAEPPDLDAAIGRVEAFYSHRGIPARFRVGREVLPVGLDGVLAARGYRLVATTRVLALALPAQAEPSAASIEVADEPDDDWLSGWLDVKASGTVDPDLARAVVTGSAAGYLTTRDDDGVVGVIRAGYSGDWVGLSCLMVAQRARRRGLARALTLAAMEIAAERGARRAFLQVAAGNHAALELYHRLGFADVDTYNYRER